MHGHRTASHSSDDVSGAKAPMRRSAAIPNDRGGARASASLRRTYKYRLYPTAAQERELERQLGVCCDLYNAALEQRQRMWRDHGVSVGFREQSAQLTEARRELTALAGMNALAQHEVLHKAIADRHEVVAIEDLNVRAMSQSARATVMTPGRNVQAKAGLSRAIADAAWGDLRELLAYKLEQRGGEVIAVSVAYTSQTCAECGQVDHAGVLRLPRVRSGRSRGRQRRASHRAARRDKTQRRAQAAGGGIAVGRPDDAELRLEASPRKSLCARSRLRRLPLAVKGEMKSTSILSLVVLIVLVSSATAAERRPSVVLGFHGGGFLRGTPADLRLEMQALRRRGIQAESVAYPLGKGVRPAYDFALRRVQDYQRRGYRVVVYGGSAGGTIVAYLAARGYVDSAVAWAPPLDLVHFAEPNSPESRILPPAQAMVGPEAIRNGYLSPVVRLTGQSSPTVIYHSTNDQVVDYSDSVRYRYWSKVLRADTKLVTTRSGHLLTARDRPRVIASLAEMVNSP